MGVQIYLAAQPGSRPCRRPPISIHRDLDLRLPGRGCKQQPNHRLMRCGQIACFSSLDTGLESGVHGCAMARGGAQLVAYVLGDVPMVERLRAVLEGPQLAVCKIPGLR